MIGVAVSNGNADRCIPALAITKLSADAAIPTTDIHASGTIHGDTHAMRVNWIVTGASVIHNIAKTVERVPIQTATARRVATWPARRCSIHHQPMQIIVDPSIANCGNNARIPNTPNNVSIERALADHPHLFST